MTEYIKREDIFKYPIRMNHYDEKNGDIRFVLGVESVLEYAKYIPAADVQPIRQGEWIEEEADSEDKKLGFNFQIVCSCCHNPDRYPVFKNYVLIEWVYNRPRYCSFCGAKMRGEIDNG